MNRKRQGCCDEFARTAVNRRTLLKAGGLGMLGLSQSDLLRAEAAGQTAGATAKSVILLFNFGGPSHLETFDPKPDAPAEVGGEFAAVDTRVPGRKICEHLPQLAGIADKYSLVRTLQHTGSSHNPGAYSALTGKPPLVNIVTLNASANDFPHPGSVVDYLDQKSASAARKRNVPAFVSLPTMMNDGPFRTPGEFAGFLGKKYDPLWVLKDPNSKDFNVNELKLPGEVDVERLSDRRRTLKELTALSRLSDEAADVKGIDEYQQRAMELLTSTATQQAFAIHEESDKVRDRYGRTQFGQSVLLARRLVQAGVRFVTVYYSRGIRGWDMHETIFPTMKNKLLPNTDRAVSALLTDLHERNLLDETLVYWTGDFGRTPKINSKAGRDHWPQCGTALMAGGGIEGGREYGESDASGAYPHLHPSTPADVIATVYHALGLDHRTLIRDQLNRPMPVSDGEPLLPLFG